MKHILNNLFNQQYLSRDEANKILGDISEEKYNLSQISSFLTVFKMRNISLDELIGFRDCLRERCISVDFSDFDCIDVCGTGGDGKDTFNISTLSSFVIAGAGYPVAKHGNYGVSSVCGSSNVMESLGYKFSSDKDTLKKQLKNCNITFLHAPLFHPAMKVVAPIRRELGVSTFFNMLGPMVNPSFPQKQMVGVFSHLLQRYYKYIFEQEDVSYRILYSLDGFDEISLTEKTKVITPTREYILDPLDIIHKNLNYEELKGGNDVKESAEIFTQILDGKGTQAQNMAVIANAAMAILCYHPDKKYSETWEMAKESLESGKAKEVLKKLLTI